MRLSPRQAGFVIGLMLLLAAVADAVAERYPLSDAHWDAAIYLLRARAYVEGDVLGGFREAAPAIHDAVMRGVYPTPYWSFMRVGQTILLGTVVDLVGTNAASIHVVTWLYRGLLATGLLLAAMLAGVLASVVRPAAQQAPLYLGAIVSVALYLLSDVASYMSGNLVSEVPAIFFIALSAWALLRSWATGSRLLAVVAGAAGFLLYVVRMESVWSFASLLVAMAWLLTRNVPEAKAGWQSLVIAASVAALLFGAYSWFFFPLTDPRLALRFSEATAKFAAAANPDLSDGTNVRSIQQLIAANGLLWIGALFGLRSLRTDRAFQFGAVWFLVSLVPVMVALTHATDTQTRVYTTLAPTLVLLSSLGWAHFLGDEKRRRFGAPLLATGLACAVLVAISQPASYAVLRDLPGLWRLQHVRPYLAAMPFERVNYHVPELMAMTQAIIEPRGAVLLLASPRMQAADYIMVVQYLLPRTGRGVGAASGGGGGDGADWNVQVRLSKGHEEDARYLGSLPKNAATLLLGETQEAEWIRAFECCGRIRPVAQTHHYALHRFEPTATRP